MRPWARSIWRPLARARDDERGITIVEGIVAALLLVLGALATLQVFDVSTRTTYRAAESQVLNNRLQAELEAVTQLSYSQIAMAYSPGHVSVPNDPRARVLDTSFAVARDGSPESLETMVIEGEPIPGSEEVVEGGFSPEPLPFSTGDISGQIYRFVTWVEDPCPGCGEGMMKRVVVAATIDEAPASFERRYQELQTTVADPSATPDDNPAPPQEEVDDSAASLWLTDTTCDVTAPAPPTASHPTHNTRGRCADGGQEGETRGAPDLLFTSPPELCDGCVPEQPEVDYSDDVPTWSDGVGLTMIPGNGCVLESPLGVVNARALLEGGLEPLPDEPDDLDGLIEMQGATPNKRLRVHTWLSPPVTEPVDLTGTATLELYTRHPDDLAGPAGEICVIVFVRQEAEIPVEEDGGGHSVVTREVDVPFVNVGSETNQDGFLCELAYQQPFFRCKHQQWPVDWTKVTVPMQLGAIDSVGDPVTPTLPAGSQIGVALAVSEFGSDTWLEFMYDAVGFESRLEVQAESVIEFE